MRSEEMTLYYAGVDAGSTYVKAVIMDEGKNLVGFDHKPTGIDAGGTADAMIGNLCSSRGISPDQIKGYTATGYSRRNIVTARNTVTEIKAHAAGALWSAPQGVSIRSVIDIGGQDSKVIVLDDRGDIAHFTMNDKCAAGTGRFLESLARALELTVEELGPLSLQSTSPLDINSTCVVFAESEVISLVARKKKREDIVAGIHLSLCRRISAMARKVWITPEILLTGGGGLNAGIAEALENTLLADIHIPAHPQLNGAIGAAIIGMMNTEPGK